MTSTVDTSNEHVAINFSDPARIQRQWRGFGYDDSYGIWSCKFSADGNEIVAGARSHIFGMYLDSSIGCICLLNL